MHKGARVFFFPTFQIFATTYYCDHICLYKCIPSNCNTAILLFQYTTATNCSCFDGLHIWFVSNRRHDRTLCITSDLIWMKQQVSQKIAFYFQPKLAVCSEPSQMCVILKKYSCLVPHAPMPHINYQIVCSYCVQNATIFLLVQNATLILLVQSATSRKQPLVRLCLLRR